MPESKQSKLYHKATATAAGEMPREKMIERGPQSLSDSELVAILLNTGYKGLDVSTLSKLLVKDFGLKGLFTSFNAVGDLASATELPPAKSCSLSAVGEIIRRLTAKDRAEISCAADAFEYFSDLQTARREQVRIVCLNAENIAFYSENVALGGENQTTCPLIAIFHPPVRLYSQRIIIAHNHPRGKATPSDEDLTWHTELLATAEKLGVEIIDHIIVGTKDFYSFTEEA